MEKKQQRLRGGDEGSSGVVPMAMLPHDLVVEEVLTRLPAKSLMRFKCVSKLWCSTISDPSFVKAHFARSPSRPGLLQLCRHGDLRLGIFHASLPNHEHDSGNKESLPEHIRDGGNKLFIIDIGKYPVATSVVQGFVCLYTVDRVAICNVSTREIMELPPPLAALPNHHDHYTTFEYCYYLGFVRAREEYNLLRVCSFRTMQNDGQHETCTSKCEVLTLGKDKSWRSLKSPPIDLWNRSIYLDGGVLCWWQPTNNRIISFYFKEETFHDIRPPPGIPGCALFQRFQGHLALVRGFFDRKLELSVFEVVPFCEAGGETPNLPPYHWINHVIDFPHGVAEGGCSIHGDLPTGEHLLTGMGTSPIYTYDPTNAKFEKILIDKFPLSSSSAHPSTGGERLELDDDNLGIVYYEENITPLKYLINSQ